MTLAAILAAFRQKSIHAELVDDRSACTCGTLSVFLVGSRATAKYRCYPCAIADVKEMQSAKPR